jgi:hypothetical protein
VSAVNAGIAGLIEFRTPRIHLIGFTLREPAHHRTRRRCFTTAPGDGRAKSQRWTTRIDSCWACS